MQEKMLSILVVDDARFSTRVVERSLSHVGYNDLRCARSGEEALNLLDQRPADIVIADWLMPEMDGLVLTRHIRQLDEAQNRYTYVILLTAREGVGALQQAFDEGVDDFVHKSAMAEEMLPRIMAAERLTQRNNRLLKDHQRLIDANGQLRKQMTVDPLTGMELPHRFMEQLKNALLQCEKRGGHAALVVLRIDNLEELQQEYKGSVPKQIVVTFARRLTRLVRPMDILGRLSSDTFGLVTYRESRQSLAPGSFQRFYEHLNNKAFKTAAGFVSLKVSVAMSESDGSLHLGAKQIVEQTQAALPVSVQQKGIAEVTLRAEAKA